MTLKACNVENMKKFVAALRSGDYVQGHGTLEGVGNDGKTRNCCLGVACRVAIKDGLNIKVVTSALWSFTIDGSSGYLPESVSNWLGIDSDNPRLYVDDQQFSAVNLNDYRLFSFDQIADAFERTYLTP